MKFPSRNTILSILVLFFNIWYSAFIKKNWQTIRRGRTSCTPVIRASSGDLLSSQKAVLERWREYFADLLNPAITTTDTTQGIGALNDDDGITEEDVAAAIKSLPREGILWLLRVRQVAWDSGKTPMQWQSGIGVPIFKRTSFQYGSEKVVIEPLPSSKGIRKEIGEPLNLTCTLNNSFGKPSFSWITPGRNKIQQYEAYHSSMLFIGRLQASDSGNYVCKVTDQSKRVVFSAFVHVEVFIRTCRKKFFQCLSGHCIPKRYACDGRHDCPDGSDEAVSYCGMNVCDDKIRCSNRRCISKSLCCYPNEDEACKVTYVLPCCHKFLRDRFVTKLQHKTVICNDCSSNSSRIPSEKTGTSALHSLTLSLSISFVLVLLAICVSLLGYRSFIRCLHHEQFSPIIPDGPVRRIFIVNHVDSRPEIYYSDPAGVQECAGDVAGGNLTSCPSYSEACLDEPPSYASALGAS